MGTLLERWTRQQIESKPSIIHRWYSFGTITWWQTTNHNLVNVLSWHPAVYRIGWHHHLSDSGDWRGSTIIIGGENGFIVVVIMTLPQKVMRRLVQRLYRDDDIVDDVLSRLEIYCFDRARWMLMDVPVGGDSFSLPAFSGSLSIDLSIDDR